jgi:hypothetical protein
MVETPPKLPSPSENVKNSIAWLIEFYRIHTAVGILTKFSQPVRWDNRCRNTKGGRAEWHLKFAESFLLHELCKGGDVFCRSLYVFGRRLTLRGLKRSGRWPTTCIEIAVNIAGYHILPRTFSSGMDVCVQRLKDQMRGE